MYDVTGAAGFHDITSQQQQLRLQSLKHLELLRLRQIQYKESQRLFNNGSTTGTGGVTKVSVQPEVCKISFSSGAINPRGERGVSQSGSFRDDPRLLSTRYTLRSNDGLVGKELSTSMSAQEARQNLVNSSNKDYKKVGLSVLNGREDSKFQSTVQSVSESAIAPRSSSEKVTGYNAEVITDADPIDRQRQSNLDSVVLPKTWDGFNSSYNCNNSVSMDLRSNDPGCTPEKFNASCEGTPKSILQHRSLIDRNVHVESKYEHTPTTKRSCKTRLGLNHSYTDVDDLQFAVSKIKSVNFDLDVGDNGKLKSAKVQNGINTRPAAGTRLVQGSIKQPVTIDSLYYTGSPLSPVNDTDKKEAQTKSRPQNAPAASLLLHTGNDRKNAQVVCDLDRRPSSDTFAEEVPTWKNKAGVHLKFGGLFGESTKTIESHSKLLVTRDQTGPLLGYDWIAGLVDNERSLADIPDDYFEEVKEFRRLNKDACVGSYDLLRPYEIGRPVTPEVENPSHTCIHGYTVNERLFTEPVNVNEQGSSICPICRTARDEPTEDSPGFVRVSIPRTTFEKPYKFKPHRRRSFDETDSCALSTHCLAGWECTHPTVIPTASNLDLRFATDGLRSQMTTTEDEIQNIATGYSRASRLVNTGRRVH